MGEYTYNPDVRPILDEWLTPELGDDAAPMKHQTKLLIDAQAAEIARLKAWVDDLQSGMYVNCVYCGHRYGPGETTPVSMADVLRAHVESCPKHPMSALKERVRIEKTADPIQEEAPKGEAPKEENPVEALTAVIPGTVVSPSGDPF